jgi:alpha-L-fucosidase
MGGRCAAPWHTAVVSAASTPTHPFADRPLPTWYDDAKFGIFIHWGPFTVPCFAPVGHNMGEMMEAGDWAQAFRESPYSEWYLNSWSLEGSSTARHHAEHHGSRTYESFVEEFHARSAGFDISTWADLFVQAGARYVVPITKHHDGFVLWRTSVPNPFKDSWMSERDHIADLADAVRERGMRFGTYYSGGLDWTFEPPPIDSFMSMINKIPSSQAYLDYATAHVHELVDRFAPDVLWNDIAWPLSSDPNEIFRYYYDRVPEGVVNDRWNLLAVRGGALHADFSTPEYSTKADEVRKWEVCRGIGRSFGYNRAETEATMTTVDDLVWMLVDIVARGGNLLLNVGPTADGVVPLAQVVRLTALGWWLRVNGDAIFGTRPWTRPSDVTDDGREVRFTCRGADQRYAIVQGAPAHEVRFHDVPVGEGTEIRMLGNDRVLPHTERITEHGHELLVSLPDHLPAAPATVFSISG